MIDDLVAYTPADAPVKNPSVTIGGSTLTFNVELHSGDFVEYFPEFNQAYHNYFAPLYDEEDGALKAGVRFWQVDGQKPLRATMFEMDGFSEYQWDKDHAEGMVRSPKRPYIIVKQTTEAFGEEPEEIPVSQQKISQDSGRGEGEISGSVISQLRAGDPENHLGAQIVGHQREHQKAHIE
jgi:hypothetical protein